MPRLVIESPNDPRRSVDIRDGITAGRNEEADIVLRDPKVSRKHLRFHLSPDGQCSVSDLDSSHGTLVNGKSIRTAPLKNGDTIQLGDVRLTFVEPEQASEVVIVKDADPFADPTAPLPTVLSDDGRKLRVFYEVAKAIREPGDRNKMLDKMLETILDVLSCERVVVGLYDWSVGPEPLRRIARVRGGRPLDNVVISKAVLDATLVNRSAIIACGPTPRENVAAHDILSAMGAPLTVGNRLLGFLYVDDRGDHRRFRDKDLDFLSALAHLTATAIDNADRYEQAVTAIEVLYDDNKLGELIGDSPAMRRLRLEIQKYAASPSAHVHIRGESGTGKELVARTLHRLSPRNAMPLVTLNCAAIPETMVESELFGYVKGAFTGALGNKRGKFALADGGTLFLDEIGDLSLAAQAKVLRAVEQGEVTPLGSEKTIRVNVRLLSATHKDLAAEVAKGRFREDLLYRLNVLEIVVPPLRERAEDIPRLAHTFLKQAALRMRKPISGFTAQALAALVRYRFPGNVRELQNEVEHAVIVADGGGAAGAKSAAGLPGEGVSVDIGDMNPRIWKSSEQAPGPAETARTLAQQFAALDEDEKSLVEEALAEANGVVAEAARLLGISRAAMRARMERFKLDKGASS